MTAIGLIPVRLNSSRLQSKALLPIEGVPMVVHTMKRAMLAKKLSKVYVCTDSDQIANVVNDYGGEVIHTKSHHQNGTERIAEAAEYLNGCAQYFIDIQGDEPLINPSHIDDVIVGHQKNPGWEILLPSMPFNHPESQHVVKVSHDVNKRVIYLSRSVIPCSFRVEPKYYLKHLSIISFTAEALVRFAKTKPTPIEVIEGLELMRAIESGMTVGTIYLEGSSFSVDVVADYEQAKIAMKEDKYKYRYLGK